MIFTGCYAIERILRLIDEGDIGESQKFFKKVVQRYPHDLEVKRLHDDFENYLVYKKAEELDNILEDLNTLRIVRKIHPLSV